MCKQLPLAVTYSPFVLEEYVTLYYSYFFLIIATCIALQTCNWTLKERISTQDSEDYTNKNNPSSHSLPDSYNVFGI